MEASTPLLTVVEVGKNQQQTFDCLVAHVLQLTYAAMLNRLIQEEKLKASLHNNTCQIRPYDYYPQNLSGTIMDRGAGDIKGKNLDAVVVFPC